jgi:hypothetical protein
MGARSGVEHGGSAEDGFVDADGARLATVLTARGESDALT